MEDELVEGRVGELAEAVFEVGSGGLGAGADGVREVLVIVATGTGLEEMGAVLIDAGHEQADSVGSFGGVLGLDL